ncbi:hypothetical protein A3C32_04250 [Candidatus Daviesbacteria bacterium RIFCSPHIGHO2_02_FULL_41_14]|uniref:Glycosyltransferase 2-like domain-containing protein n=1 Tax=Candidatus Daviesbacteria bacterium RIFCSPLOWO2_01_FULL_40_24 TaxID=1797787 RepID=A0A1F5MJA7_9BACT|nr:MAG: hypothetical protein A3C32_04250 [Candidatus Daviesbacteria bacterium RIFCSPHIGHO2_02_FULL_41_14]OGE65438.1 MAG: hypothetical protein A3B49_00945 [Candidatus Daviesbacteria bacterium RIFCSPLOWO2_01_FULL_40_24]
MKKLKFSIIIATYNGERYLEKCLSSVFKTIYPKFEVIIVDDGSTDGSLQIINKYKNAQDLIFIRNNQNIGLVKSRNKAIKKSTGDILVFLDNDTEVDKKWIVGLSEVFLSDNSIGAAQCKMFDIKNRKTIQQAGMKLIPFTGFGVTIGRGEKDSKKYKFPMEIISLGASLAVRKSVTKVIGGFDENLFHYCDDLDFSWRVWIAGFRIMLAPNAKVYHYLKVHNPNHKLYFHLSKNSYRMMIKNYEISNTLKFLPTSILFSMVGALNILLTRNSLMGIAGVLMGLGWSVVHLSDTLVEREKVQKYRRARDCDIFSKIMISTNLVYLYRLYFQGAKTTANLMKAGY